MEDVLYAQFDVIEENHWWWRSRRAIVYSLLDSLFPGKDSHRVLDFGCGMGGTLKDLPKRFEGHGADVEPKAVAACKANHGLENVVVSDGMRLPYDDGHFDAVLALDVLEHIDDPRPPVAEIRRVLKRGGVFIASVPAFPWLWTRWDEINLHKRRYTKKTLRPLLNNAGLSVEFDSYINCLLMPLAALRIIHEKFFSGDKKDLPIGADVPSGFINRTFERLFSMERHWLGRRYVLPWGSSLLAVARRKRAD